MSSLVPALAMLALPLASGCASGPCIKIHHVELDQTALAQKNLLEFDVLVENEEASSAFCKAEPGQAPIRFQAWLTQSEDLTETPRTLLGTWIIQGWELDLGHSAQQTVSIELAPGQTSPYDFLVVEAYTNDAAPSTAGDIAKRTSFRCRSWQDDCAIPLE